MDASDAGETIEPTFVSFEDELFGGQSIATLEFTIAAAGEDSLRTDGTTWVSSDLTVRLGERSLTLPRTGIRLKGNGSRRPFDGKAAFNLRFDRFDSKQTLGGVKRVALNNMVQDPSMIREYVAYSLLRQADVPTQRTTYARVVINGQPFGLHLLIEAAENDVPLTRWFGDSRGTLFESSFGGDLAAGNLYALEYKTGPDETKEQLSALISRIDTLQLEGRTFLEAGDEVVSTQDVLTFIAAESLLGHWDGSTFNWNNAYLYLRSDGRVSFIPWGLDQTFQSYRVFDPLVDSRSRLATWCAQDPACRLQLAETVAFVQFTAASMNLEGLARLTAARIHDAVTADPRREQTVEQTLAAQSEVFDFLSSRMSYVDAVMWCVEPSSSPDRDGDGVPGCGIDCDDNDPTRHQGMTELCNLRDDDCDDEVDEDPSCPSCTNVWAGSGEVVEYCFRLKSRDDAEADCASRGGHLATVATAEQSELLSSLSRFAYPNSSRWIGATDIGEEGTFVWADGAPVTFTYWSEGEPNNIGEEDCAAILPFNFGRWNDMSCAELLSYFCSIPVSD